MLKLNEADTNTLIDALELVAIYKKAVLKERAWATFERNWLPSAAEQLSTREFKLNHPTKNFFVWFIDQINHAKVIIPGIDPKYGTPFIETKLAQHAVKICYDAAKGQKYYDLKHNTNYYNNLFE